MTTFKDALRSAPAAVVFTLLGIGVIGLMLDEMILDLPGRDAVPARDRTPAEIRDELREEAERKLRSYGWVDREQGRVRIPAEQAMDALVRETREGG